MRNKVECRLDGCQTISYAKGWCRSHYGMLARGRRPRIIDRSDRPCSFDGCEARVTAWSLNLCAGHARQHYAGIPLKPMWYKKYTEIGRVCRGCGEDKPLTEYYLKNGHLGRPTPAGTCKQCAIKKQMEWYARKKLSESEAD